MSYYFKIRQITLQFSLILLICFNYSINEADTTLMEQWNVQRGETQIYIFKKFFSIFLTNNSLLEMSVDTFDGEKDIVYIEKGYEIVVLVTSVEQEVVRGQVGYRNDLASPITIISNAVGCVRAPVLNFLGGIVVRKTINNKEYWIDYCTEQENAVVSGHYIEFYYTNNYNTAQEELIEKWNWKTGWKSYQYRKIWNDSGILSEVEIFSPNFDSSSNQGNIIFGGLILSVSTALIIFIKKFHKES